ncbi:MAG: threonine--tRNA ligase [Gammaproteobacteria bacterium]|nr:threonine--tRNA ligase [Gammaproteobacteria bacterium]MCY4219159.1 threonine--tRNA ligase [Gammaproteobacteria bacterium]
MPQITLPDGSNLHYDHPVTIADVAFDIGPGLGKVAIAGKLGNKLVDVKTQLIDDCKLQILTAKDEEGLQIIRHSTAHLMAHAVKQLYPSAQVTIGPVITDGFYYDFYYPDGFTESDLEQIESRMSEIARQELEVDRYVMGRSEAIDYFQNIEEEYKAEIIRSIPDQEKLSFYKQGDFTDLCRGPHVPNTRHLKAFKLTKISGAYWRGDPSNEMLQRVYGTAWADKKQLKNYLRQIAEAEKRDHRRIGRKLDLFHFQEEAPGMVFWHPRGWTLYQTLQQYMRDEQKKRGYFELNTPEVLDFSLWEKSGHADKFASDMFSVESEGRAFALKPMSCPGHVQIYNQGLKSYRELPLRYCEFGSCHRNELSGALHGLMRVRAFVQDDGHIFCTENQIQSEVSDFIDFLHHVYEKFGFTETLYRLSTRPINRVGSDEVWDTAEKALADALDSKQLLWEESPGEGAFYGPKIEFSLRDSIGRVWQCGTMQVDFSMPERLGASYIDEQGEKRTPVLLHRAVLGTFERFIGILIEHWEGKFPVWFAPVQAVVMNITDRQRDYAQSLVHQLEKQKFRAIADLRNEKIGYKIREHTLQRVPYLLVVGDQELDNDMLSVRSLGGNDLGTMSMDQFVSDYLVES